MLVTCVLTSTSAPPTLTKIESRKDEHLQLSHWLNAEDGLEILIQIRFKILHA
jgi:hypothetical protein